MKDDDETTPEEQREAEALVRALERDHAAADLPEDALEAAALLQYSRDGGALDPARKRAIWDDVEKSAKAPAREARPARIWRWLVPGFVTAAAAIALLVLWPWRGGERGAVALPAPPAELIDAQSEAATGSPEAFETLARRMSAYRVEVYATLEDRYGR